MNPLVGQGHRRGCLASCSGTAWSLHRCWCPALPRPRCTAGCQDATLLQPHPGLSRDPVSPSLAFCRLHTVVSLQRSPSGQPAQPPEDRHPALCWLVRQGCGFFPHPHGPRPRSPHHQPETGVPVLGLLPSLYLAFTIFPESKSALVLSSRPDPAFPRLPHLSKYQLQPEMWGTSLSPTLPPCNPLASPAGFVSETYSHCSISLHLCIHGAIIFQELLSMGTSICQFASRSPIALLITPTISSRGPLSCFLPQGLCTHCSLTPIPTHLPRTLFLLVFTRLAPSQLLGLNEKVASLERLFLQLHSLKGIPLVLPVPESCLFPSHSPINSIHLMKVCVYIICHATPPPPPHWKVL